ncbi:hypothetical protein [Dietzia sp. MNB45]|uniref:hypothetical protein n=1 Tax=Dietzia sp. MNB45 TaxID=3238800 RepID=UPI003F80B250
MATFREGDYNTVEAAVELAPYTIVKHNADGKAVKAAAGTDLIRGVVEKGGKAGDSVSYARVNGSGTFKVRVGGTAVAKDALLTSNASGLAVTATTGDTVFGRANVAGEADSVVEYDKLDTTA